MQFDRHAIVVPPLHIRFVDIALNSEWFCLFTESAAFGMFQCVWSVRSTLLINVETKHYFSNEWLTGETCRSIETCTMHVESVYSPHNMYTGCTPRLYYHSNRIKSAYEIVRLNATICSGGERVPSINMTMKNWSPHHTNAIHSTLEEAARRPILSFYRFRPENFRTFQRNRKFCFIIMESVIWAVAHPFLFAGFRVSFAQTMWSLVMKRERIQWKKQRNLRVWTLIAC